MKIIDWKNLAEKNYKISPTLERIKKTLEKGIVIIAIQKERHSV